MFLQGQISLPLSIYNIFTGSNQSPFIDLKCFYRVKSISLFSIYKVFTGSDQFLSSFYDVFTGSKQSPCIDLLEFYRFKSVSLFLFTIFLQGQMSLSFSIYKVLKDQISLPSSISKVFKRPKQCLEIAVTQAHGSCSFQVMAFCRCYVCMSPAKNTGHKNKISLVAIKTPNSD